MAVIIVFFSSSGEHLMSPDLVFVTEVPTPALGSSVLDGDLLLSSQEWHTPSSSDSWFHLDS